MTYKLPLGCVEILRNILGLAPTEYAFPQYRQPKKASLSSHYFSLWLKECKKTEDTKLELCLHEKELHGR